MDLKTSLCPRRDDGDIDHRYMSTINAAIELAGKETVDKLLDFSAATSEAEKAAAPYAVRLCLSVLMADKSANEYVVKALKKQMRAALQDVGFKPTKASIVVVVAEFQKKLIDDNSHMCKWVSTQPLSSQIELARTNDKGLSIVWAEISKWGTETVTRQQLRQIQDKHPKVEDERRGRPSFPSRTGPKVTAPYVAPAASTAVVDSMSSASPVRVESYEAPAATTTPSEAPAANDQPTVAVEAVAVSILDVAAEASTAVSDLLAEQAVAVKFDQVILQLRDAMTAFNAAPIEQKRHCYRQIENISSIVERALSNR